MAVGVVKRLGIDYPTVKEINPGVIYCSISGYGQTGSASNRVGHDVNYLSMAGVLGLIGEKKRLPVIPGIQVADIAGVVSEGTTSVTVTVQRC